MYTRQFAYGQGTLSIIYKSLRFNFPIFFLDIQIFCLDILMKLVAKTSRFARSTQSSSSLLYGSGSTFKSCTNRRASIICVYKILWQSAEKHTHRDPKTVQNDNYDVIMS